MANSWWLNPSSPRYPHRPRLTVVSKHLLAEGKNFLHGGGRAEANSPTVAERLRKLFIFL